MIMQRSSTELLDYEQIRKNRIEIEEIAAERQHRKRKRDRKIDDCIIIVASYYNIISIYLLQAMSKQNE